MADDPDRVLGAAPAGALPGHQHMNVSIFLIADMVHPGQFGTEELLVATAGAAVQEHPQGPIERLDGRKTLSGGAACQQDQAEGDGQDQRAQRHYRTLPSRISYARRIPWFGVRPAVRIIG